MILTVINQKGGVGKTTTAICLATGLAEHHKHTLLVDTDPQCNATDTYRAQTDDIYTLYDLIADKGDLRSNLSRAADAIQHTDVGDIIAGDPLLKSVESQIQGPVRENRLKRALSHIATDYDYIIIDTPPQAGLLQNNALAAADACIVPITPDRYALAGLSDMHRAISEIRDSGLNDTLVIAGLLLVRVDPRQHLVKDAIAGLPLICEQLGTKLYRSQIRDTVAVRKSQAAKMSLYAYERENGPITASQDYHAFVEEVLTDGKVS